jgi:hypothetical protein
MVLKRETRNEDIFNFESSKKGWEDLSRGF